MSMTNTIFAYKINFAVLSIKGPDALSFINRMSTNDMGKGDKPVVTAFVTAQGKMVDYVVVYPLGDEEFLLVSSHRSSSVLLQWLEKYHFVEDLEMGVVFESEGENTPLNPPSRGENWLLFVPIGTHPPTESTPYFFHETSPHSIHHYLFPPPGGTKGGVLSFPPLTPLTQAGFHSLRLPSLLPLAPTEINDTVMPQNLHLDTIISLSKGCFIGQEVLSKASLYQKHKRTLKALTLTKPEFQNAKEGDKLTLQNGTTALITSLAPTYIPDDINALGLSAEH